MTTVDVVVMGRATVDLYSLEPGVPLAQVSTFARYLGGCPGNFSVGIARLGQRVGFVGKVGQEQLGEFVRGALQTEGIDTTHVTTAAGALTGLTFLEVSPPDRFPFIFYRQGCADLCIAPADVPVDYIAGAALFFTAGLGLSASPSYEATLHALETARGAGVTTVFDIDYRPGAWGYPMLEMERRYGEALARSDVVIGTLTECAVATGEPDINRAVESVFAAGPARIVVAKQGADGSTVYTRTTATAVPPFPVQVLNVLGAGDGFAAGFCTGLLEGREPAECARMGNAVGAIVASRHACAAAMPRRDEVDALMAGRQP